jgi:hypothetical protein
MTADTYTEKADYKIVVTKHTAEKDYSGAMLARFNYCYTRRQNDAFPVVYSDKGGLPHKRISADEMFCDLTMRNDDAPQIAAFTLTDTISKGETFWFGGAAAPYWKAQFVKGGESVIGTYGEFADPLPDEFPLNGITRKRASVDAGFERLRFARQYRVRLAHNVKAASSLRRRGAFTRQLESGGNVTATIRGALALFLQRVITDGAAITGRLAIGKTIICIIQTIASITERRRSMIKFVRFAADTISAADITQRIRNIVITLVNAAAVKAFNAHLFVESKSVLTLRSAVVEQITLESEVL